MNCERRREVSVAFLQSFLEQWRTVRPSTEEEDYVRWQMILRMVEDSIEFLGEED